MQDKNRLKDHDEKLVKYDKDSFWRFFIDNARFTYFILVGIVILGLFSIINIPKESAPEVDFPVIVISTALPGASAIEVEELITARIENRIQGLSDLESFVSTSQTGFSQIVVNFNVNSDGREKLIDTRESVERVINELPTDASRPTIQQISFSDRPILNISLSGPYELIELKEYAELLRDEIEKIRFVSNVNISGAPREYIEVIVNQELLNQFEISLNQINQALRSANSEIPIGSIETAKTIYTLRLDGKLRNAEDVRNTPILNRGGAPILMRDIGTVIDAQSRPDIVTRYGAYNVDSEPSVSIQVFKQSGEGDIITIVDQVEDLIEEIKTGFLPDGLRINIIENNADNIREDLSQLLISGLMTVLIVLFVLILFLGWREALLASLVVPLTFLITFFVIEQLGYTINFLTLFSLILSLGILVDASIVVTESIFKNMEEKKCSAYDAVLLTIHEFQKPLIAGTMTTVFVFLPMLLLPGIIGKFIRPIPITVSVVLLSAIFVSLAIITTLAARLLKSKNITEKPQEIKKQNYPRKIINLIYEKYNVAIHYLLNHRKPSKYFLIIVSVLFVISLSLPVVGLVKVNMFPSSPQNVIFIDIENPEGTPLSVTLSQLSDIEMFLIEDNRIRSFLTTAGARSDRGSVSTTNRNHVGSIVVRLDESKNTNSFDLISEYEEKFSIFSDTKIEISKIGSGPPSGSPVQVNVIGEDLENLFVAAEYISGLLEEIHSTRNISSGFNEGSGEFLITVNRKLANEYGLSPLDIASTLRTAISGNVATTIKSNNNDTDVLIRYDIGAQFSQFGSVPQVSIADLQGVMIPSSRGPIPLSIFADVQLSNSLLNINRRDGERIISVTSDLEPGGNTRVILRELRQKIDQSQIPAGVDISFGGEAEDIAETFSSLGVVMFVGILLIFGLLIWQFNSYKQPFYVLTTIPLAIIGVLPGLAITNQPFSFPGFIGVVALSGIVVNNAIILIDAINNNKYLENMDKIKATEKAAKSRLQPIILTTLTTVSGMMPLALSDPSWAPLAFSIIFGLIFSTVSTLFIVPILYVIFEK